MAEAVYDGSSRSLLYVPAHVERFVAKAPSSGADAVILDLEDSVPDDRKAAARADVAQAARRIAAAGPRAMVRINRPLGLAVRDVEAAVCEAVQALLITKVDGASHLRLLDELVCDLEAERGLPAGRVRFIPIIEDPRGLLAMAEIFAASPRSVAALLGGEDYARSCGMEPGPDTLLAAKQQLVVHARAAGLVPLGLVGSLAGTADDADYRAMLARSRRFGFGGATCIHPGQVASLNRAFTPSAAEVDWAARAVEAYEQALRAGRGAVRVDGKMVDKPVAERARAVLLRAGPA